MRFWVTYLVCAAATATLVASAACTSFNGDTPPAVADGGASPDLVDGGAPPELVDGGDAGSLLPAFCVFGEHAFCADFEGADPLAFWTVSTPAGVSLDGERVVSGVASLRARDARRPVGASEHIVGVAKVLPRAWSRVLVELSLFVAKPTFEAGDNNGLGLLALNFVSSDESRTHGVALSIGAGAATFGASKGQSTTVKLGTDAWTRIRLDITPNKEALLVVGSDAQVRIELTPAADAGPPPEPSVRLEVGSLGWNSPSPAMDVRVDDVTIDFAP